MKDIFINPKIKEFLHTFYLFKKSASAVFGLLLIFFLIFISIGANFIAPYDPIEQDLKKKFTPPNLNHLFGTDHLGRDIFSRIVFGSRVSLFYGILTVFMASIIGITIGTISGFFGGNIDHVLMRITEIFMAFPTFLLAMTLAAALGPSLTSSLIAMLVSWWPSYTRLVRGLVLSKKEELYILSAKAIGKTDLQIVINHILPNIINEIIVKGTMDLGKIILTLSMLGFMGLGAQPPTPEWGFMISTGRRYILQAPWVPLFPGLFITISALGFNLIGDGLRDALDPKIRTIIQ